MKALAQTRRPQAGQTARVSRHPIGAPVTNNHRGRIASILVPIDFSPPSMKALECALQLANQFNARLTVLHVVEVLAAPEFATYPLVPDSDRLEKVKRKLAALAKDYGCADAPQSVKVRTGVPFREITRAAESLRIDLIVIATHGYTGIAHVLLGSTAERVVRHARCPVLVLPSKN